MIAGRILIAAGGARFFAPKRQLIPDRSNRRTVQINLNIVSTLVAKKHTPLSANLFLLWQLDVFSPPTWIWPQANKFAPVCKLRVNLRGVSSRSTWSLLHAFFFSLYCVVYSENTTKRYKTLLLALPFFTFGSFVFFSKRNNNQIGKLHLVVTRTLHFALHATIHGKLHAIFSLSLPSALLILHFCIHKHLFNSALITSPPNQTRKTITWAHSRLL